MLQPCYYLQSLFTDYTPIDPNTMVSLTSLQQWSTTWGMQKHLMEVLEPQTRFEPRTREIRP
jgi:hypothetical protein